MISLCVSVDDLTVCVCGLSDYMSVDDLCVSVDDLSVCDLFVCL